MTIEDLTLRMIDISKGNLRDIAHFMQEWGYARTIGRLEGLDARAQYLLEAAALVHDIACPLCREKYGSVAGPLQEREGAPMALALLTELGMDPAGAERVAFLVGHHHTLTGIDAMDWQILAEADFIVNAAEKGYPPENIRAFLNSVCRTNTGAALIRSVFQLEE